MLAANLCEKHGFKEGETAIVSSVKTDNHMYRPSELGNISLKHVLTEEKYTGEFPYQNHNRPSPFPSP